MHTLGIYISVPFCKAKCSYCNFASGVFAAGRMQQYVDRVCMEMAGVRARAVTLQAQMPERVDSIYLGGGTPSLLAPAQLRQLFERLRGEFDVANEAEITLECAPGQIADATLAEFVRLGVNRISFGVQSFVDQEAAAVGRLHTGKQCIAEIERVRAAGIAEINIDLIAGLPHQTPDSWRYSLDQIAASGVPHASVYMLEVDEDSRLGSELLAGGMRYHAHFVPEEDLTADLYLMACEYLHAAGIRQYEISNFAREGHSSRHNLKYWQRSPYLGFGLDAHSMLLTTQGAVRFANVDDLDAYTATGATLEPQRVSRMESLEESLFLGLRLAEGVDVMLLRESFGADVVIGCEKEIDALVQDGLLTQTKDRVHLTAKGRLLSNDVFARLMDAVPV
ncbi:MAG: radical SAM family heme chaperone HemW [Acidobacteriaceae bacterium]